MTSNSTSTRTISVPNDVRAGHLIVLAAFGDATGTTAYPTTDLTSGYTERTVGYSGPVAGVTGRIKYVLAYKIADGTEGGTTIQAFSNAAGNYWSSVLIFRQQAAFTTIGAGSDFNDSGDDTGQQISYTAQLQDLPFICVAAGMVVQTLQDYEVSITNDNLTSVFYRAVDRTALRVLVRQFISPGSAETITSTVTGTEWNGLYVSTLLPE